MVHTFTGDLGHLFVIISLVTAFAATYAFYKLTTVDEIARKSWSRYATSVFYIHGAAVLGVALTLFFIIYNHYFEYHYAWSHSSKNLPVEYIISCFWGGQEGSFLLWMFWNAILGIVLINTNNFWKGPVMTVFALVQAFLASMILGVVILDIKIGSSPFILLRDALNDPIFTINPDFVPEDGTGLNPILQNYWMVIHPPTLFLGFATTLIPFAYCISGLWIKKYSEWIRPALPWALFSAMVLGVGILMGAYWAYETLNFGGYWNWDPVENAVYVPWLVLVASYHTMITYKNSNSALKTSIVLVVATFILILYATFLVRSGILGDSSVHSFVDLGLSGQLLIYLFTFLILSVFFIVRAWKHIPSGQKEVSTYSREFWIFIGATTLCLMGFQVLIPTSIPVFNSIVEGLGGISNMAPPADAVSFYTKFQLWFGVAIAILSGTGQFFWWKKMDHVKLKNALITPIIATLMISIAVIMVIKINDPSYLILLTAGIYSIIANFFILIKIIKGNFKLSGGSIAHIGVAMILIGIMFSSGYSKVISLNNSGLLIFKDPTGEMAQQNLENVVLWLNEPRTMDEFEITYKGPRYEVAGYPGYIKLHQVEPTRDPYRAIAKEDLMIKNKKYFSKGDTVKVHPENTYYEVEYTKVDGEKFVLFPRLQINPTMGNIASPDIKRNFSKDLYTHINAALNMEEREWSETQELATKVGERFFINDYVAVLEGLERVTDVEDIELGPEDVAVKATINIYGKSGDHVAEPLYIIKDRMAARPPVTIDDLGLKIALNEIKPETNTFVFGVNTTQKDYIVLKAIEKPMINILWIGTFMLVIGFLVAISRRYTEFIRMRDKGIE
jgi:cytochrome c-type biogenesis protein CcmF